MLFNTTPSSSSSSSSVQVNLDHYQAPADLPLLLRQQQHSQGGGSASASAATTASSVPPTSKYLGVSWDGRGGWGAYVWVKGKSVYLGTYGTEWEAARACAVADWRRQHGDKHPKKRWEQDSHQDTPYSSGSSSSTTSSSSCTMTMKMDHMEDSADNQHHHHWQQPPPRKRRAIMEHNSSVAAGASASFVTATNALYNQNSYAMANQCQNNQSNDHFMSSW